MVNVSEPIVAGTGRYRIHRVRSGFHVCFQVEWQREYKSLRRERVLTKDGAVIEYFALPCWEATAWLFDDQEAAGAFARRVLESRPMGNGSSSSRPEDDPTDTL